MPNPGDLVPLPMNFDPGLQRDGTEFEGNRCLDSLWCRWRLGRPRKMGGFKRITDMLNAPGRRIHCFYQGNQIIAHVGHAKGLQQVIFDQNGNFISIADRTPFGFAGGLDVGWTLDSVFDTTTGVVQLIAHSVPDINVVANPVQTIPFLGRIDTQTQLAEFSNPGPSSGSWVQPNVAGGIFCVQPYVFSFDEQGGIAWSAPNQPLYLGVTGGSSGAGAARISSQQLVAGTALRGGGAQSPAGLVWSLSEVIAFSYLGVSPYFAFNTVSPSSSILAGATVVEYDSLYFWVGQDRFMVYNGVVNEVPNPQNQDWFFANLNRAYAGRSFGFKIPQYGEIWWCAPMFGNQEPSHAIIYNVRENTWYDTELPNGGRTAAYFAQGFKFPILTGTASDSDTNGLKLWMGEVGVDQQEVNILTAIRSNFTSPIFGGPKDNPPSNNNLSIQDFEPDLTLIGDATIQFFGQANNRAPLNPSQVIPIPQVPAVPQEEFSNFKDANRLWRFQIESNVIGGNYIAGRNLLHGKSQSGMRKSS